MKKRIVLILILVLSFCTVESQSLKIIKLQNPKIDDSLSVKSHRCNYYDSEVYIINKNYVVFENCETRKILYPDMKSFRIPKHNEGSFAIDKNGVYLRGSLIKIDTTGFKIIGERGPYRKYEYLWKTNQGVYKDKEKLTDISSPETFKALECFNGQYFIDKNFVYHFDEKIEGSDAKTIKKTCGSFTYDKNFVYNKGEKVTHNDEFVIPVNDWLLKTKLEVLTRNKRQPWNGYKKTKLKFHIKTLRGLSGSYAIDKNHVYYEYEVLPIKKKNFKNIRVFEQVNSAYITDGINVYNRNILQPNLDGKTFYMFPELDALFDKNGVYNNGKIPFKYTKPVTAKNTFMKDGVCVYENQAYTWKRKLYKLTPEQVKQAKKGLFLFEKGVKKMGNYKVFDYLLYRQGDKVYYNDTETGADGNSFKRLGGVFKDTKNVYTYSREKGLRIIAGVDVKSIEVLFYGLYKDKNYVYYGNSKIIKSNNIEVLGIFTGYRKGCGMDRNPSSNFYLLKNIEGYWLVENRRDITIRFLGKKLQQKDWYSKLKKELVLPKSRLK